MRNRETSIGPQIPNQQADYSSAYSVPPAPVPGYYPNQTFVNQVPGMYNPTMPGMPMPGMVPPPPPPVVPPMTPAIRKAEDSGPGAEKKARTDGEADWAMLDPVSLLSYPLVQLKLIHFIRMPSH